MNYQTIKRLQRQHGLEETQERINNGIAWRLEGSVGRHAMSLLNSGACMLPKKTFYDYYGNAVPSRDVLQKGSKGTYHNSVRFWTAVQNGEIDLYPDEY